MPLVDVRLREQQNMDPSTASILRMISGGMCGENDPEAEHLQTGMYLVGHWNPDLICRDVIKHPWEVNMDLDWNDRLRILNLENDEDVPEHGVCDTPQQLLEKFDLNSSRMDLVVFFVKISKAAQPADGGWRWHKWGEYIGDLDPQCEYIYDEKEHIQEVYTFGIYVVNP